MARKQKPRQAVIAGLLDDAHLRAIGDVIVRWSRLEWQLANLVVVILGIPKDAGRVLTGGMEINVILAALRTVTHDTHWIKDAALVKKIRKLASDVRDDTENRHNYAHGIFAYDFDALAGDGTMTFFRYLMKSAPHRISPDTVPVDVTEIQAVADAARDYAERAMDLTVHVLALRQRELAALPESPKRQTQSPSKSRSKPEPYQE